jgi:hypothetical protein
MIIVLVRGFTFSHRPLIVGISVKATSNDTITANAIVSRSCA